MSDCTGCDSQYCWSNYSCQKFENDNVVNLMQGNSHCNEECLGGCFNSTSEGCVVCKGFLNHNSCVSKCPTKLIALEHYQRCYTKDECIKYSKSRCPKDFYFNETLFNCEPCGAEIESCVKHCNPVGDNESFEIFNLADADTLKGCKTVSGNIIIYLKNKINEPDLVNTFLGIVEVHGYVKIYRSPYLTSLNFLRNLKKITGAKLENEHYALVIYDNKNLRELWNPNYLVVDNGSLYIQGNNKLCNRAVREFRQKIIHNQKSDSLQSTDQEVLCGSTKLILNIEILSYQSVKLVWRVEQTSNETEILYRHVPPTESFTEESELDSNICTRINWQRHLKLKSELQDNGTHYSYIITGLKQNTKYACLIKTFGGAENDEARSDLKFLTTNIYVPNTPKIVIYKKTENSLSIKLLPQNTTVEFVRYYELELYEFLDDMNMLDQRNYCNQPAFLYKDMPMEAYTATNSHLEDYDDCCTRLEEETEDYNFASNMRKTFGYEYCGNSYCLPESSNYSPEIPVQSRKLEPNETTHTFYKLQQFRLYVLQVKACNEIGCSTYGIHSERTNYSLTGDKLDSLKACRVPGSTVYVIHFEEPQYSNGPIVSYIIHYRIHRPEFDTYLSHINCVTRKEHVRSNYQYIAYLNETFAEVAVRVHSLARDFLTHWINVTECSAEISERTTKIAGLNASETHQTHSLNIFLLFFLMGAGGTVLWICYKRRIWQRLSLVRRILPVQRNLRVFPIRSDVTVEDRQILVDGFETVRFHNAPDDDQKYLD